MNGGNDKLPPELEPLAAPEFDLRLTLECGQVFHWQSSGAGFIGMIGDQPLWVQQEGENLFVSRGHARLAERYFSLDHPLAQIYSTFPSDPAMADALAFCRGLRIIRQPEWECLATFITSSMKQVAHIAQISDMLRRRFGTARRLGESEIFAYPGPDRIAAATEEALRGCSLGYRAKNLSNTARMIAEGKVDLAAIREMDDERAREELLRLPGVGTKVANCVLLFAYGRLGAFPIDVWIERVLRETYFKRKRKVTTARLKEFSADYFGAFGGYAQQYLFHHARKTRGRQGRKVAK